MNKSEHEAKTIEAKHIFIDIVEYTHNRCVEAQSDLIATLNKIVKETIKEFKIKEDEIIYSSTGDGMCISLINVIDPYDVHIKIALLILEKKSLHNDIEECKMRQFDLRIGINENTDNLIVDINGHKGVSGSGINHAARIESLCDKNQIIVGNSVYDKLVQRENYMHSFTKFPTVVKHGLSLDVFQYKDKSNTYLNNEIPQKFQIKEIKWVEKKIIISKLEALYMLECIKNERFSIENIDENQCHHILPIIYFYKAEDKYEGLNKSLKKGKNRQKIETSLNDYYQKLLESPFWIICDFRDLIVQHQLKNISEYFEYESFYINKKGKETLLNSHPDLCKEYDITF